MDYYNLQCTSKRRNTTTRTCEIRSSLVYSCEAAAEGSGLGSEHEVGNQGCCLLPQSPLSGGQKDEKQIEMHS